MRSPWTEARPGGGHGTKSNIIGLKRTTVEKHLSSSGCSRREVRTGVIPGHCWWPFDRDKEDGSATSPLIKGVTAALHCILAHTGQGCASCRASPDLLSQVPTGCGGHPQQPQHPCMVAPYGLPWRAPGQPGLATLVRSSDQGEVMVMGLT